jgi:hypothetical protein
MNTKENQSGTYRQTAIIVGVLFIIGTVSGILSVFISDPLLEDPNYLIQISKNPNQLVLGAVCVLTMGLSLTMVPVMMFPILRKHSQALALGSVVFRGALEGVIYIAMVISWLLLIILSQVYINSGAPDASQYLIVGTLLQESDDLMNIVLQIVFSIGAMMFYTMFYQTKLIPRWLSLWGLIGSIPYFAWGILALFGLDYGILMVPLAVQEMAFALWLIIKGFNTEAITALSTK